MFYFGPRKNTRNYVGSRWLLVARGFCPLTTLKLAGIVVVPVFLRPAQYVRFRTKGHQQIA